MTANRRPSTTGLRRFLDLEQQSDWLEGGVMPPDADERPESLELRFRYLARYEKLLRKPQAEEVLEVLRLYSRDCLPIPRRTERYYWSVSCLPSTPGKALTRISASWMELFSIHAEGDGIRALFLVHLSDFTTDGTRDPEQVDAASIEGGVAAPEDVSYIFPRGEDIFGIRVHGLGSIKEFMAASHALHAVRRFNLTWMNRSRNAYQASHCYSLADHMLDEA
ncbi:hypothetical protein [Allosphingosinicella sp.]|uniref:hypothetical protein n=1 Tax=Allosphingosinicella sp. TaxID=2823234 RepID=UPI0037849A06